MGFEQVWRSRVVAEITNAGMGAVLHFACDFASGAPVPGGHLRESGGFFLRFMWFLQIVSSIPTAVRTDTDGRSHSAVALRGVTWGESASSRNDIE